MYGQRGFDIEPPQKVGASIPNRTPRKLWANSWRWNEDDSWLCKLKLGLVWIGEVVWRYYRPPTKEHDVTPYKIDATLHARSVFRHHWYIGHQLWGPGSPHINHLK